MTISVIFPFHLAKIGSLINTARFNPAISVLYTTLDILISFQTRSRSCPCYCVLQTD